MSAAPVYQWQPSTARIAAQAGIAPAEVIRFDHNTSAEAPPWAAAFAAEAAATLNEYPAADYTPLREAIADHHGVEPDCVVPGAGADEMILLCARAFLGPGDRAVADVPTYPLYRIATAHRGGDFIGVPRPPSLVYPTEALCEAAAGAVLTWLCVPSNPVGDRPPVGEIEAVRSAAGGVVVVDAAYAEFTDDRWEPHDDLVVLGTLSKAFGLAGIRVGYAVTTPERAAALHAVRPPGSISAVSAAVAERALRDRAWVRANVTRIAAAREDLVGKLRTLGLDPFPSVANFVLAEVPEARTVAADLMARGLVARSFPPDHPLAGFLRFTARTPDQHDRLIAVLEEVLP